MAKKVPLNDRLRNNPSSTSTTPAPAPSPATATPDVTDEDVVRKEFKIRPDQSVGLARLRRRINAVRKAAEANLPADQKSASMTDAVLARVALDFLLEHEGALTGWSEQELLTSLRSAQD